MRDILSLILDSTGAFLIAIFIETKIGFDFFQAVVIISLALIYLRVCTLIRQNYYAEEEEVF
jgi:hypothetical protein